MAATTTPQSRESRKKLKPKPKTEGKSWQNRNAARKEKQTAHAAKHAEKAEA
jgi:inorganic pyrophosphatase